MIWDVAQESFSGSGFQFFFMDSGFGSRGKRFRVYQFKGSVRLCGKIVASVVGLNPPIQVVGHSDVDVVVIQTLYSVNIEHFQ